MALPQAHAQLQVPDPVEEDLLLMGIEKSGLTEDPVLRQPVLGKGEGQSQPPPPVLPQYFNSAHILFSFPKRRDSRRPSSVAGAIGER